MYATYAFRFAELYIMKAELLARTNPSDISGALAPLNEMRAKYTNPVMTAITGITTQQQLMDAIYKEYVVTLFMENESPWFASWSEPFLLFPYPTFPVHGLYRMSHQSVHPLRAKPEDSQ